MLKPEVAREELKKLEKKDWAAARTAAADSLPGGLMRDSARSIFGADKKPHPDTHDDKVRRWELLDKNFQDMDEPARRQFFETCAPGLGGPMASAWNLLGGSPYQSGFTRKPFRAPGHPETLIHRRIAWLISVLKLTGPYA